MINKFEAVYFPLCIFKDSKWKDKFLIISKLKGNLNHMQQVETIHEEMSGIIAVKCSGQGQQMLLWYASKMIKIQNQTLIWVLNVMTGKC